MAEAGLLVDKTSGQPRSEIIPWFDRRTLKQYKSIKDKIDVEEIFSKTGLYPSYKYGLAKILWLKESDPDILSNTCWLSVADYICYRLTGKMVTDYTLAARTFLFNIIDRKWDQDLIKYFKLNQSLLPPAYPSGTVACKTKIDGLEKKVPISIAGHDHVCAALAVGAIKPGIVFDSMGTAETLMGTLENFQSNKEQFNSGMSFGCHIVDDKYFWMGGLSASGGSIEWIRKLLDEPSLSYQQLENLIVKTDNLPTGILYYPYLSGSGAPFPFAKARGAIIGLDFKHGRSEIVKAVLEGTSYQLESIRRKAETITKKDITKMIAVGGGTRNDEWMKIKSSVTGCIFDVITIPEATLLGAALVAALGSNYYADTEEILETVSIPVKKKWVPDLKQHQYYQKIYEDQYSKLQSLISKQNYDIKAGEK